LGTAPRCMSFYHNPYFTVNLIERTG